jgi:hypothetical protein
VVGQCRGQVESGVVVGALGVVAFRLSIGEGGRRLDGGPRRPVVLWYVGCVRNERVDRDDRLARLLER